MNTKLIRIWSILLSLVVLTSPVFVFAQATSSPSPQPSISATSAPIERVFSITSSSFSTRPHSLVWLKFKRLFATTKTSKIEQTLAITNTLLLNVQQNVTDTTQAQSFLTQYKSENQHLNDLLAKFNDPGDTDVMTNIVSDRATQIRLFDNISSVASDTLKNQFVQTRQVVLQNIVLLVSSLPDSQHKQSLNILIHQYSAQDEKENRQSKETIIKDDLEKEDGMAKDLTPSPQPTSTNKSQSSSKSNVSVSSHSSGDSSSSISINSSSSGSSSVNIHSSVNSSNETVSSSNNSTSITIEVDGTNFKNSSRFSVNKGSTITITFVNRTSTPRHLTLSNGISSDDSSNGHEVKVKSFTITQSLTFSVPGVSVKGSLNVL